MAVVISGSTGITLPDNGSLSTSVAGAMVIDSTGAITMPFQPAFSASLAGIQYDIPTGADTTMMFASERFDLGSDFNTSTYTFTAPVTGKYQLNVHLRVDNMDTATTYYRVKVETTNQRYQMAIITPTYASDPTYNNMATSVLADMDAGDTAYVMLNVSGGAAQADVQSAPTNSHFSGYLVA